MGKWKERPLNNVLSVRVDDERKKAIVRLNEGRELSVFLLEAVDEKIIRDEDLLFRSKVNSDLGRGL
ncbi:MAG: hypothetical protein A2Y38_10095 [Spirochaetes bacterium GWB1_59_5]|nr:MAG: hypothetical protein A2Y38_10095 [Spirochaetes bacterium GWB1_59_5]